jgi:hypothetical protein
MLLNRGRHFLLKINEDILILTWYYVEGTSLDNVSFFSFFFSYCLPEKKLKIYEFFYNESNNGS